MLLNYRTFLGQNVTVEPFFLVHSGLPREGPGSDKSTSQAIALLRPLPSNPRILDVGCGPGRQSLVLARQLGGLVTAIDIHQPYLDRLRRDADDQGLAVETENLSMRALPFPPASFDLIWAEGSAYIIGLQESLRNWHPLLRAGGQAALTELTWLTPDPPAEAARFWAEAYPAMSTVEQNVHKIQSAGYHVRHHFALPESDWWEEYLRPLQARMERLRDDTALATVLEQTRREMDAVSRWGSTFGYVFYIFDRTDFQGL